MEGSHDKILARLDELSRSISECQQRLAALEAGSRHEAAPALASATLPSLDDRGELALDQAESLAPLVGWAFLGIAGAYLLRAATESSAIPLWLGAAAGMVYAAGWLLLAARRAGQKPLSSTINALTAAGVLAPLLWETTVRFHVFTVAASSAVAACFTLLGLAIAWRRSINSIAWIATLAGLLTTTALFRESHDAVAWCVAILAIAVAVEFSACRDHWLGLRWVVAIAADFSVFLLTFMATRAAGAEPSAAPLPPGLVFGLQIGLLTLYLASTTDRTLLRHLTITGFEIGQAAVACAISIGGALSLANAQNGSAFSIGMFCLAAGAATYIISFRFLDHGERHDRNFYTYSTFALLLTGVGCWVLMQQDTLAAASALLAVLMLAAGFILDRDTLRIHSGVYLIFAVLVARLVPLSAARIVRNEAGLNPDAPVAFLFAAMGAFFCYGVILADGRRGKSRWADSVEGVVVAALAILGLAGLGSGWLDAAPLRTALLTALSIVAAWASRRWQRDELRWLAYPMLGLAGYKLIAEDFQQGRSITLFASLIFFGGGLILLPRLLHRKQTSYASTL